MKKAETKKTGNPGGDIRPIVCRDGKIFFLDQTALPSRTRWLEIGSAEACRDAIARLAVRGAPAIGIAAAFGMVLASRSCAETTAEGCRAHMKRARDLLALSRPTAVNLFWALDRVEKKIEETLSNSRGSPKMLEELEAAVEEEALSIQREDEEVCRAIGVHGQKILRDGMTILTHCNAGALATSRYGTALAPVYVAKERGLDVRVFADETRPLLQGSRLTAYELLRAGIGVTLITDGAAAAVMRRGWIDACIVGCDRVAANGDTANKIGTYGIALLAKLHAIPFYVACPLSTIDLSASGGEDIQIEERGGEEVVTVMGRRTAPAGVNVFNPAFDVTPNRFISGFITEKGIVRAPYAAKLEKLKTI
ncbi:MAG: S-methyl-5-thioribose-1-phosphate isomerase [Synergistaceae bacterium]|jgi:methylthioribose-1-phosphate isomerase|nr:S-methyl-5-thioribose-1-phosphate isomerase [Synergistaceae bacterium]